MIFVSINYRTGPFGFPQGQEAEQRGALNLGIKDMFAALTWVQSNIGAFGGDNSKVSCITCTLWLNLTHSGHGVRAKRRSCFHRSDDS